METVEKTKGKKKNLKVYIPVFAIVIFILMGAGYWYHQYMLYIKTDDAVIDTERMSLGSKILGRVVNIHAQEGDSVKEGQLLIELDSTELLAQLNQSMALKNQIEATLQQSSAKLSLDQGSATVLEIALQRSKSDFDRAKVQFDGGVITAEQFEHIQKNYETAKAQFENGKKQINVTQTQFEPQRASVKSAESQIELIKTQLRNTRIFAPMNGIISKRWILPGDIAQPGQSILSITRTNKLWVAVYIEETQLSNIHILQDVIFKVDAFPRCTFHGKVFYTGANTASQFSLIPPNNAAGNFTKVTQRVLLKVSIDTVEGDQSVLKRLISGMSVVVKIVK
jgi:membrane fusion protein (multidrug efflux system)